LPGKDRHSTTFKHKSRVRVRVEVSVSFRVIWLLLLIDINTFLNDSLVETNGAIWCTFREMALSRSVPTGYKAIRYDTVD